VALLPATAEAAPTWLSPVSVSAAGGDAEQAQIAVSGRHETIVIWRRFDGDSWIVQASIRPFGGSFSPPVNLSRPGEDASAPRVASGGAGQVVVVWTRSDGTNTIVEAATRPPDGQFSASQAISDIGEDAAEPRIAVAPMGRAMAVWLRSDGTHDIVQTASLSAVGSNWSAPEDLSGSAQDALEPQAALAQNGTASVVWISRSADDVVEASTRRFEGAFSAPEELSAPGQDAAEPQVGLTPYFGASTEPTM
jgi:hypothetical protein